MPEVIGHIGPGKLARDQCAGEVESVEESHTMESSAVEQFAVKGANGVDTSRLRTVVDEVGLPVVVDRIAIALSRPRKKSFYRIEFNWTGKGDSRARSKEAAGSIGIAPSAPPLR